MSCQHTYSEMKNAIFSDADLCPICLLSQLSKMEEENKTIRTLLAEAEKDLTHCIHVNGNLRQTILTAHYWLGNYTNDADNATHAKRILHNAIHEFKQALAGKGEK